MARMLAILLVLTSLLGQALAAHGGGVAGAGRDAAHAALHWQDAGHHHHDDGSFHADDSDESAQHLAADGVSSGAALFYEPPRIAAALASARPLPAASARLTAPYLDGPRRPPRLTA